MPGSRILFLSAEIWQPRGGILIITVVWLLR